MKKFNITVNGTAYDVEVEEVRGGAAAPAAAPVQAAAAGETTIDAPMPGKILEVKVSVGQAVKAGDTLVILEAMKMQNEIPATVDGTVKAINCSAGQSVKVRDSLVIIG